MKEKSQEYFPEDGRDTVGGVEQLLRDQRIQIIDVANCHINILEDPKSSPYERNMAKDALKLLCQNDASGKAEEIAFPYLVLYCSEEYF